MLEMPLVIPCFYYPIYFGLVMVLLTYLIRPGHERYWRAAGIALFFVGVLMWVFVPELEVVIW